MVNVGVIGCGYWGPNLIRNLLEVAEANVLACCDAREERRSYAKKRFPQLTVFAHYGEMLADPDIDAVCIATPVSTHYSLVKEALLNGKHVLVEKPMTYRVTEAEELISLSEERKKVLMVGHTFEYTGAVNKIKELISSGGIGDVYYLNSSRVNLGLFQHDINVIWDLAPHDISIMLYVLDLEPTAVSAFGESYISSGIEDVAYITVRYPNKVIAHLHVSWLAPVKSRKTVVAGSKKMLVYDDVENVEKVKVFDKNVLLLGEPSSIFERQLIYRTGDVISPKLDTTEPLKVECGHFIECIIEGTRPRSDGISGLRVVQVLEAAQKSLEMDGEVVQIPLSGRLQRNVKVG
jgi:predicted dehydrogenase